jgi:hypothetical protein
MYRVYSSFTMETILATAFGRRVDILRGESDELSKSIKLLLRDSNEREMFNLFVLLSKFYNDCRNFVQALICIAFCLLVFFFLFFFLLGVRGLGKGGVPEAYEIM